MSRVHDALRRSGSLGGGATYHPPASGGEAGGSVGVADAPSLQGLLEQVREIPWDPASEAHLIDAQRSHDSPTEEFRSLRTRLNHLQSLQQLRTLVVTSASPAEGKSFTAANLAIVESHLQGNPTLLCDFDFRRPIMHNLFKIDRAPGLTEYLQGKASLGEIIKRISGTNLYICPAGSAVINPLELLNLKEVKVFMERMPSIFGWVILDTPPLLFAADANLLSTYCDGTLLVVRLGQTTIDSVTRALAGLSHNNVIGVVANAAKRGELYSKYTYYHSYYYYSEDKDGAAPVEGVEGAPAPLAAEAEGAKPESGGHE
ncbi:MAG: CpsD/CapB family tyrosine-protein kinase [Bryobacteraceae bacterium]